MLGKRSLDYASRNVFDLPIEDELISYRNRYGQLLENIRSKSVLKVAFQVIHKSIWKYDRLYRLMSMDPRFQPVIFVCPYLRVGPEQILSEMNATYHLMKSKGYHVIRTYDEENDMWVDIKNCVKPDIVFFSVPYDYTFPEYQLDYFTDSLTCYVPYLFTTNGK